MSLDPSGDPASIVVPAPGAWRRRTRARITSFDRHELSLILGVYGRMLTGGMARDYAIDHLGDRAVFSIFRRSSEPPLYRIEKRPAEAHRQGAWRVVSPGAGVLGRGGDLARVLRVFDRKLIRAVE